MKIGGCEFIIYLHARRGETGDFFKQPVRDARIHGRAARKHNVAIELTANIKVTFVDGIVTGRLFRYQVRFPTIDLRSLMYARGLAAE
jgi:hypothetical protein